MIKSLSYEAHEDEEDFVGPEFNTVKHNRRSVTD
jgi:hypothetical protein